MNASPSTLTQDDEDVKTPIKISAYEKLRTIVTDIVTDNAEKVFVYTDPKGNKLARSHVFTLRTIKADIGRARVEAKADALEYGRQVDAVAKDLTKLIDDAIAVHQAPLDEIEAKETARKTAHRKVVDYIIGVRVVTDLASSQINDLLVRTKAYDTANLEEFKAQADDELLTTIRSLESSLTAAIGREAEAAELARLRKEADDRAEVDRVAEIARKAVEAERKRAEIAEAERIAKEAKDRSDAEAAQLAVQAKKDREAIEATTAAIKREQAARAAEEAAVAAKIEAEKRVADAEAKVVADAERRAKEDAEQASRRERLIAAEANNKAIVIAGIVASLRALAVDGKATNAQQIADAIAAGKIKNVVIDWTI